MPNHVRNRVEISGPNASRALSGLVNSDGHVDFNLAIRMPSELDLPVRSDAQILWETKYGDWKRIARYPWVPRDAGTDRLDLLYFLREHYGDDAAEAELLADRYESNRRKHGYPAWDEWCEKHWNTRHNAFDDTVEVRRDDFVVLSFSSAYAPPEPVLKVFASNHPDLVVTHYFADESLNFFGMRRYEAGRVVDMWDEDDEPGTYPDWLGRLAFDPEEVGSGMEGEEDPIP